MRKLISSLTATVLAAGTALAIFAGGASADAATTCPGVAGPITSSGASMFANGQSYVPYGVTVSGLEHPNYQDFSADDAAQISAAQTSWCANIIRLQVSQAQVVSGNTTYRAALQKEVRQAVDLGMAVVINDQTQHDTAHADTVTAATHTFWADMAARYKTYKRVIFDLLNEPTGYTVASWQAAFKPLAQEIRAASPNMIWVEGPQGAQTLAGVGPDHFMGVSNTAYEIHHPLGDHNAATWEADYGYLQGEGRPVVDGEWTNWSANRGECWTDAPTAVPAYLAWMQSKHIGMALWAIGWDESSADYPAGYTGPAVLADGAYSNPVGFGPDWSCTTGLHQGAGQDIMNYYQANN